MGDSFNDFVLDQLSNLGGVECRPMFGGYGLYCHGVFFGILYRKRVFFRTDEQTRGEYQARGMQPFRPSENQTLANYYEVPLEVIEDDEAIGLWAHQAIRCGRQA